MAKNVNKGQSSSGGKKVDGEKNEKDRKVGGGNKRGNKRFPPYSYYKKTNHLDKYCWYIPTVQCRICKQFSHIDKCKNKGELLSQQQAQVVEGQQQQ